MAGRARRQTRQFPSKSVNPPKVGAGVSRLRPGDLVEVHMDRLFHQNPRHPLPIWLRVERCDYERRIFFGTVESGSPELSRALATGSRLGVSYDLVR